MKTLSRYNRLAAFVTIGLVIFCTLAYLARDFVFGILIQPGSESAVTETRGPQSTDAIVWVRRPETQPPGGWETPWGVDVFFVHPTTVVFPHGEWNGEAYGDREQDSVDRSVALYEGALRGAGSLYAPGYRQAVLQAMLENTPASHAALDLAYSDVLAAFDTYVEQDNRERAIILVGVEQGGLHVARLLRERFSEGQLRQRLGAAYLADVVIPQNELPVPECMSPKDTGCVVAWRPERSGERRVLESQVSLGAVGGYAALGDRTPLCVNPVSWRTDQSVAPLADHAGAVADFGAEGVAIILPHTLATQCDGGMLKLLAVKDGALRRSAWWGWGTRLAPGDFNLFYADLAANVSERARLISVRLDENGRKPAKPLPPIRALEEAPIHRSEGAAPSRP